MTSQSYPSGGAGGMPNSVAHPDSEAQKNSAELLANNQQQLTTES